MKTVNLFLTLCVLSHTNLVLADSICYNVEPIKRIDKNTIENNTLDLKLDKETAIKIAETILIFKYGKRVIGERPWNVSEDNTTFTIIGSLPRIKHYFGGVAEIVIQKSDAKVLRCTHGK